MTTNKIMRKKIPRWRSTVYQNSIDKWWKPDKIDTPDAQIHDSAFSWLDTGAPPYQWRNG